MNFPDHDSLIILHESSYMYPEGKPSFLILAWCYALFMTYYSQLQPLRTDTSSILPHQTALNSVDSQWQQIF